MPTRRRKVCEHTGCSSLTSPLCILSDMRLDLFFILGSGRSIFVRPYPGLTLELPGPVIDSVASRLCDSLLLLRSVHRTLRGHDAQPWLNSSTPLLANLTTYHLLTICHGTIVQASNPECPV